MAKSEAFENWWRDWVIEDDGGPRVRPGAPPAPALTQDEAVAIQLLPARYPHRRQLDTALDLILAQALRARGRAIELHDMLSEPDYSPAAKGRASAFATLVELDVNELVRQAEKLRAERSNESGTSTANYGATGTATLSEVKPDAE